MKRVWIAIALLLIVVGLSGGALWIQHRATDHLIASCDALVNLYQQGKLEQCRQSAKELSDDLEKHMRWFPFFLKHERMESIFQQAGTLPYLVNNDEAADFFSSLTVMRVQLAILMDNEWPTPENIL